MKNLNDLFKKHVTTRNSKLLFILLTLIGLVVASGAPGAGSGIGGGPGFTGLLGF